jgi:hypothetical protein
MTFTHTRWVHGHFHKQLVLTSTLLHRDASRMLTFFWMDVKSKKGWKVEPNHLCTACFLAWCLRWLWALVVACVSVPDAVRSGTWLAWCCVQRREVKRRRSRIGAAAGPQATSRAKKRSIGGSVLSPFFARSGDGICGVEKIFFSLGVTMGDCWST